MNEVTRLAMAAVGIDAVLSYVDEHQEKYVDRLAEIVAIKSISAWREFRPDVIKIMRWMKAKLEIYGVECELKEIGEEAFPDKSKVPLPPVLLGSLGNDPAKKTVLVYGHLDVQPALRNDGWETDPFVLTEKNGNLYGRGATDDKGPAMGWLNALEAYQNTKTSLPVNLKFLFEGMEESGSKGLADLLAEMKNTEFFRSVDIVCISDSYWLGTKKPCITYGFRGLAYFNVKVECAEKDLHSGVFGGTVYEAMNDLIWLLSQLTDVNNKILIPGIMDDVAPVTPDEEKLYNEIEFDLDAYQKSIGCAKLVHAGKKTECLQARWRYPSLSLHGIEGAFYGSGNKTVIPRKVIGKFSIRLVPNQDPEKIEKLVIDYLNELWKKRGSPNKLVVTNMLKERSWLVSPSHPYFQAGVRATTRVYGSAPDLTCEGGTIPIILRIKEIIGKSVILLPIGQGDDGAHSQKEKISKRNFIQGTKVLAAYLHEVAQ